MNLAGGLAGRGMRRIAFLEASAVIEIADHRTLWTRNEYRTGFSSLPILVLDEKWAD